MVKQELLIIADYSKESFFTLEELCDICNIPTTLFQDFILLDIIKPVDESKKQWVFDIKQLQRVKMALRLQHDLELNFAGIALVLDLLEEMQELRARAELLEKHLL